MMPFDIRKWKWHRLCVGLFTIFLDKTMSILQLYTIKKCITKFGKKRKSLKFLKTSILLAKGNILILNLTLTVCWTASACCKHLISNGWHWIICQISRCILFDWACLFYLLWYRSVEWEPGVLKSSPYGILDISLALTLRFY